MRWSESKLESKKKKYYVRMTNITAGEFRRIKFTGAEILVIICDTKEQAEWAAARAKARPDSQRVAIHTKFPEPRNPKNWLKVLPFENAIQYNYGFVEHQERAKSNPSED